jgi:hypothetical protein
LRHNQTVRGPESFEQLIAFIEAHLTRPVHQTPAPDGSITFTSGEPVEAHVRLSSSRVTVFEHAVLWERVEAPTARPRALGSVNWRRLPEHTVMSVVGTLIKAARERRQATYRACRACNQRTPPEWLDDDDVCESCAARGFGGMVH